LISIAIATITYTTSETNHPMIAEGWLRFTPNNLAKEKYNPASRNNPPISNPVQLSITHPFPEYTHSENNET
jgi:hypothetical protein